MIALIRQRVSTYLNIFSQLNLRFWKQSGVAVMLLCVSKPAVLLGAKLRHTHLNEGDSRIC